MEIKKRSSESYEENIGAIFNNTNKKKLIFLSILNNSFFNYYFSSIRCLPVCFKPLYVSQDIFKNFGFASNFVLYL